MPLRGKEIFIRASEGTLLARYRQKKQKWPSQL